jgi:hypothetical protein
VHYWNVRKRNEKLAVPTKKFPLYKKPACVVYWPITFDDQCTFFAFASFKTRTINLCEEMRQDFSTVFPAGKPVASMIGTRFPVRQRCSGTERNTLPPPIKVIPSPY